MNKILSNCSFLLLLMVNTSFAQVNYDINELVFNAEISKKIHYPIGMVRGSIYGRVFVSFEVNEEGKFENIKVVHPIFNELISQRAGFEYEILDGFKKMKKLSSKNQGLYILPVSFIYTNIFYGNISYPTNTFPLALFEEKYTNFKVLNDVEIFGNSDQFPNLRQADNVPPQNRQIVAF